MNLLFPLALGVFAFVLLPVIAHALRRDKAAPEPFPGARLVPRLPSTTQKRSRLEDRALLGLRILLLAFLTLLGATPFVSCSRLSLSRKSGGSVGLVLVIDDSASMSARIGTTTRFEEALTGARQLLGSARSGDGVAIVLAGHPARLLLAPTTDLGAGRRLLDELEVTDRSTDLTGALALGASAFEGLVQEDKSMVLLSDLSVEGPLTLPTGVGIPLEKLTERLANCTLSTAERRGSEAVVEVACTGPSSLAGRKVELVALRPDALSVPRSGGQILASTPAKEAVRLGIPKDAPSLLGVRLTTPVPATLDQIASDDATFVLGGEERMAIGLHLDIARTTVSTSATTITRAALDALDTRLEIATLGLLPDDDRALERLAALIVDDPPGVTPEAARALERWLDKGGVVLGLLGPNVERAPLGSGFAPFVTGAPQWRSLETGERVGGAPRAGWSASEAKGTALGGLVAGWHDLAPAARVVVPNQPDARLLAQFSDGSPLVFERRVGRGAVVTALLPSSVDVSDFALRPAYLALLEHTLSLGARGDGGRRTTPGVTWTFGQTSEIVGPSGPVTVEARGGAEWVATPERAGRYRVTSDGRTSLRFVMPDPEEGLRQPQKIAGNDQSRAASSGPEAVDVSREIALIVLGLGAIELLLRLLTRKNPLLRAESVQDPV